MTGGLSVRPIVIWPSNAHPAASSGRDEHKCNPTHSAPRVSAVTAEPFVPPDFDVPLRLETSQFVLEPLGPQHNEPDYAAWSSSMEHIHETPGWEESRWPREMTLDENRADLERHATDFENRVGFTAWAITPGRHVIGCVYIYPSKKESVDAQVLSWVCASEAGAPCAAVGRGQRLGRGRLAV